MGISSRDYIREQPTGGGFGRARGEWAIKYLLIANAVVFILQNMFRDPLGPGDAVSGWLSLHLSDIAPGFQIWRLVTYGFCHSTTGINHILFNMFVLWMFGRAVEPILGSREFLAFFLAGIVVSGLCHLGVQVIQLQRLGIPPAGVVGASGGVMAVVFLTAMYYPRMKVLLFFVIPIELRWLAVLYAVADVAGMFSDVGNVAHAAHLGGAAFGVAYKYYQWRVTGWWDRLLLKAGLGRSRISRSKVRIYQPSIEEPEANLDEQVDRILIKIKEQGEDSLTERERQILTDASRKASRRLRGR